MRVIAISKVREPFKVPGEAVGVEPLKCNLFSSGLCAPSGGNFHVAA